MKEPERIPLDPSTPTAKKVKKIPLPALYPEGMRDDLYSSSSNEKEFWKFIEKHKEAREKWLNKSTDEDNTKGDQT